MSFTHLNVYSGYSLMNSTIKIESLVKRANELNYSALALTDENVLYGVIPFYKMCLSYDIKPIIGMTVQVFKDDSYIDVILLAKTNAGYKNLLKISTFIQTDDNELTINYLLEMCDDLIFIIKMPSPLIEKYVKEDNFLKLYNTFTDVVNKDDLYFSLENYDDSLQGDLYKQLRRLKDGHNDINVVAINEVRYLNDQDVYSYDCLQAMSHNETWDGSKPNRSHINRYLCSKEEMEVRFEIWKEALQATNDIADKCHIEIELNTPRLPAYPLKEGQTAQTVLKEKCINNVRQLYSNLTETITSRLEYELNIIESLGFSNYFLIVADFVTFAKRNNILVGPGRGSAAGSLVSYVLGITDVDPIKHNLLFERFLNPERTSLPDIDIDFSDVQRHKVIQYVKEKYGDDHVAHIITFGTFGARSLLRELMKTLDVHERDQAYLLRHIPTQSSDSVIDHVNRSDELKQYVKKSKKLRILFIIAQKLEGLPRHVSTHAAGIVITKEKLINYVPLMTGQDDLYLTQYSMNELEAVGILKFDLLGLKNLSLIERIIKTIQHVEKKQIDLATIPENDEKTFKLLQAGKTNGIFQLESDGMKRVLQQLKPSVFEDIVALNALYRPGPMEQIPTYIGRKHGNESFTYLHPHLEPILRETHGVLIYQEQIMQVANRLAGFSLGEADLLRRAMSKKEHKLMIEQKNAFIQGCMNNGYSEQVANQLFSWIEKFSNYGFNKSHSVAYSKIAYQLSYLKAHYPQVFFAQLLSTVSNNSAKLSQYVKEATDLNINILSPSINKSFGQFSVEHDNIRIGLLSIKGIGYETVKEIINVRKNGPFIDLFDFCLRVSQTVIKRNTLEILIKSGVFDELYENRASLLASIDDALERADLFGGQDGQESLFIDKLSMREPDYVEIDDFPKMKKLSDEKELIGIYLSDHPLKQDRTLIKFNGYHTIEEALLAPVRKQFKLVSFVQQVKKIRTKRGESMAFLTVSDETSEAEVVVFPQLFREVGQLLEEEMLIQGQYMVSERNGNKQLIANHIDQFNRENLKQLNENRLFIRVIDKINSEQKKELKKVVKKYPGNTMIIVYYEKQNKTYQLGRQFLINPNEEVIAYLQDIFGHEHVILQNTKH